MADSIANTLTYAPRLRSDEVRSGPSSTKCLTIRVRGIR